MSKNRINKEDVTFWDSVYFESDEELSVYINENQKLDKIAGLDSKFFYNEDGDFIGKSEFLCINYYGIYNYIKNNFFVEVSVIKYISDEELKNLYPDIADKIIAYYNNNIYTHTPLNVTQDELSIIFEEFKEYCIKDLKEYTGSASNDLRKQIYLANKKIA